MASPSAYTKPAGVGLVVNPKTSPSSRGVATAPTLGAIIEDGGMRPDIPQRSQHRPMARFLSSFQSTGAREIAAQTDYNNIIGPRGEKFSDLRNNREVAKRGGWTRVLLIALIVLLFGVGLAVGLGVGLTRSRKSSRYVLNSFYLSVSLIEIDTVRHPLLLRPKRPPHHFQPDHTPLRLTFPPFQRVVRPIRTHGDVTRMQRITRRALAQTPPSIGSLLLPPKMERTMSYPRPIILLRSISITLHLA